MGFSALLPPSVREVTRRILRRAIAFAAAGTSASEHPFLSHPERVRGLDGATVDPTARLFIRVRSPESTGYISLGHGASLGRNVELAASESGCISIGEGTSIQDFCGIYGDVAIGAHCLFSLFIYVGSTTHRFRDRAEWLIKDQDAHVLRNLQAAIGGWSRPIVIEDDCWLGWGATVMPGTYIGRGAVIGANCVVTHDVAPYEIHGGAPNRKIGSRLDFVPPQSLDAGDDASLPYFYRGFCVTQDALARSRRKGIVEAGPCAALVLAGGHAGVVQVVGQRLDIGQDCRLRIRINGIDCGDQVITPGDFEFVAEMPKSRSTGGVPIALERHTYVQLTVLSSEEARRSRDSSGAMQFGIRGAAVRPIGNVLPGDVGAHREESHGK
jgi:acetyltransferase-like isoleucine patch superfamily enzyme